jgi:dipeptidase E
MKKMLLLSNSTMAGAPYLGWCKEKIVSFYKQNNISKVLFVPYAGVNLMSESLEKSYDAYIARVAGVFAEYGIEFTSVHTEADPVAALQKAEAISVGGGNTFYLIYMLHKTGLMHAMREKVNAGTPFCGWSAGSNVACPGLFTTNDMPIVEPASFDCLGVLPFQINPHYLDANPEGHGGETRQQRIEEFLAVNRTTVVAGLREGTYFELDENGISLGGNKPMIVFRYGKPTEEFNPGQDINFLINA